MITFNQQMAAQELYNNSPQPVNPTVPPVIPQAGGEQIQTPTPPEPKKGFPKIIIIIIAILALLGIAFAVYKFVLPRFTSVGTKQITWWGLWEDESVVSPLIAEYEQNNPGVKITYVKQSEKDYRERLTNALAKGDGPDIFTFHNTWVPMFRKDLDNVPASVINPADYAKTFYPIASTDLSNGTGLAGIPLEYDGLTLFINQDMFDKAGLTPPTTWDDLRKTAKELTQKDDRGVITQAGVALGRTENVDHWQEIIGLMMLQNGANPADPSTKLAKDAITFYTLFSSVDGVWDETLPPSTTAFAAGKLAMYFAPSWRAFEIKQQNPDLNFKTVPLPQVPKTNANEPDMGYATYWAQGVWSRSTNKDVAWDFLKFMMTKDSLQKLYQNEVKVRSFGEPYPRVDMASLLTNQPVIGSIVSLAPNARSWYLASSTNDGPTGINTQISKYYEDAINAINSNGDVDKALQTAASGVAQVLSQFGVVSGASQ